MVTVVPSALFYCSQKTTHFVRKSYRSLRPSYIRNEIETLDTPRYSEIGDTRMRCDIDSVSAGRSSKETHKERNNPARYVQDIPKYPNNVCSRALPAGAKKTTAHHNLSAPASPPLLFRVSVTTNHIFVTASACARAEEASDGCQR